MYIYIHVCVRMWIYIYIRHVYAENKETIINTINNGFAKYTRASSKLPSMFSYEWRLGINGAPHKPGCLPMCSMYDIFTMNIIELSMGHGFNGKLLVSHYQRVSYGKCCWDSHGDSLGQATPEGKETSKEADVGYGGIPKVPNDHSTGYHWYVYPRVNIEISMERSTIFIHV